MSCRSNRLALAAAVWAAAASGQDGEGRLTPGELTSSDQTIESGEYADRHTFTGRAGQQIVIDVQSTEFDPYLIVVASDGEQIENDDHEGDRAHSVLTLTIDEAGSYDVYVTSYEPDEVGRYLLSISTGEPPPALGAHEARGELAVDDTTLDSGEYFDTFEFIATAGQRVRIDLRSNDFDTYLILVPPKGEQVENDDDESASHSRIEAELADSGNVRIIVTSYESGELGAYVLTIIELDESSASNVATAIALGERVDGVLERADARLTDGEYNDVFEFEGVAGQGVSIQLASAAFDTYLALLTPGGEAVQNDDFEGDTERSQVKLRLPESGSYRIVVTSYEAGETGPYALDLVAVDPGTLVVDAESAGRVFGLFAGIGDYPGKEDDLLYTVDDAVRLRDALIRGASMRESDHVTLLDGAVTRSALTEALRDLGRRAGPEDTLVFFFSGHGDRVEREAGPDPTDPDAFDETLELYDGSLNDDDLRALFAEVDAGTSLILIDSCYSGGFAKDLISAPGRMGLFSSEEDVTSNVAAKFEAGGYLSLFLAEAIADKLADSDGDGGVTAIELSQYVYERYRTDVKAPGDGFVRTGRPRTGQQHLVVDRGSIGPYDVLFR